MKSKIKYTDEPMGELRVVKEFSPSTGSVGFEGRKREGHHCLEKVERGVFQERSTETSYILSKNDQKGDRLVCLTVSKECLTYPPSSYVMTNDDEVVK